LYLLKLLRGPELYTKVAVAAAHGEELYLRCHDGSNAEGKKTRLQYPVKGNGPLGSIVAVSDEYVMSKEIFKSGRNTGLREDGKLDVGKAVGAGTLTVIKDCG
jgi:molecular chaperone Hsp33